MLMHTSLLATLALMSVLPTTCAWFFWRKYPTARSRDPANPRCSMRAMRGDCDFYSCFERRLPCGKHWFNMKYGEPYCRDFEAYRHTFSKEGQAFINASHACMGQELLQWYQKNSLNCHDYTHEAFRALSRCYIKTGFCDVVIKDALNFVNIYQPKHLFSRGAMKIWKEMLRIAYQCDPDAFKSIITTFIESIKD